MDRRLGDILQGVDPGLLAAIGLGALIIGVVVWIALRGERARAEQAAKDDLLAQTAERLAANQSELAGRLQALAEATNHAQANISRTLEERLEAVTKRLGDGLNHQTERTGESLAQLNERLAVIDSAQKNLTDLSQQMVGLQDILSNKQARGAFGEVQLNDLVSSALPPSAYEFQATLSTRVRADCLLKLPNPPGSIVIDAKFPLESYLTLVDAEDDAARAQAGRAFAADVVHHVKVIAEKYIIPGETAESALMFLPSEAVYAELHARFRNVVEESFRRRVWIVSPTTMMATLNTVRAVLKDARMREQAGVIQTEVRKLMADVARLDDRAGKLQRHFDQSAEDLRQIRVSTEKITKGAERIEAIEVGDSPVDELPPPAPSTPVK